MGLGQLYSGKKIKGIAFMVYHIFTLIVVYPFIYRGLSGFGLGEIPIQDNSIYLLTIALLSAMVFVALVGLYAANIVDAYKTADVDYSPKYRKGAIGYLMIAPAALCVMFVTLFPTFFGMSIAFTSYDLMNMPPAKILRWVGLKNFFEIFQISSWASSLAYVLQWTVLWAVLITSIAFLYSLFIAVALNRPKQKLTKIFNVIYILPWAIPGFITITIWQGFFDTNMGMLNGLLMAIGLKPVSWLQNVLTARIVLVVIQVWLSVPFMINLCQGVIKGISEEVGDACKIDGGNAWQELRYITLPMLLYTMSPILILQFIGNLNNFGVIFLVTGGGPLIFGQRAGGTDILLSWIWGITVGETKKYNYAAVVSILVFLFTASVATINLRRTRAFRKEEF